MDAAIQEFQRYIDDPEFMIANFNSNIITGNNTRFYYSNHKDEVGQELIHLLKQIKYFSMLKISCGSFGVLNLSDENMDLLWIDMGKKEYNYRKHIWSSPNLKPPNMFDYMIFDSTKIYCENPSIMNTIKLLKTWFKSDNEVHEITNHIGHYLSIIRFVYRCLRHKEHFIKKLLHYYVNPVENYPELQRKANEKYQKEQDEVNYCIEKTKELIVWLENMGYKKSEIMGRW